MIAPASVADAGAYLARLLRMDPDALVRLRPVGAGSVAMWARLPFGVLVTRRIAADLTEDATVRARDLLNALEAGAALPARHDAQWRWPVAPEPGETVERLPAADVHRVGAAAERTLREAVTGGMGGRAVGERMLREALLDHVPIVVDAGGGRRVEVPQRLVQAVVRMGFLGHVVAAGFGETRVEVRVAAGWVGLAAGYGSAWHRPSTTLNVRPTR
jgi:hypothetical protein